MTDPVTIPPELLTRDAERFGYWTGHYRAEVVAHRPRFMFPPVQVWEITLDPEDPLTYHAPDGTAYQPDRHFLSDFGSVCWPITIYVQKFRFPRTFLMHDSGYQVHAEYGKHGLWVRGLGAEHRVFRELTKDQVDGLVWGMIRAEGGSAGQAWYVSAGLALPGLSACAWRKHRDARSSARGVQ